MPLTNIFSRRPVSNAEIVWMKQCSSTTLLRLGLAPRDITYLREVNITRGIDSVRPEEVSEEALRRVMGFAPSIVYEEHERLTPSIERMRPVRSTISIDERTPTPIIEPTEERGNNVESIGDVDRKYTGCFFLYEGRLLRMISIEDRDGTYNIVAFDKNGRRELIPYSPSLFIHPKMGYINVDNHSLFLERLYKRGGARYKRGFYSENVKIYSPSDRELKSCYNFYPTDPINNNNLDIIWTLGESLFNRTFPSYEDALRSVLELDKLSCAFSTSLNIQLNSYTNKIVLMKNLWAIGELDLKSKVWKLTNNLFTEDLDQFNIKYEECNEG